MVFSFFSCFSSSLFVSETTTPRTAAPLRSHETNLQRWSPGARALRTAQQPRGTPKKKREGGVGTKKRAKTNRKQFFFKVDAKKKKTSQSMESENGAESWSLRHETRNNNKKK